MLRKLSNSESSNSDDNSNDYLDIDKALEQIILKRNLCLESVNAQEQLTALEQETVTIAKTITKQIRQNLLSTLASIPQLQNDQLHTFFNAITKNLQLTLAKLHLYSIDANKRLIANQPIQKFLTDHFTLLKKFQSLNKQLIFLNKWRGHIAGGHLVESLLTLSTQYIEQVELITKQIMSNKLFLALSTQSEQIRPALFFIRQLQNELVTIRLSLMSYPGHVDAKTGLNLLLAKRDNCLSNFNDFLKENLTSQVTTSKGIEHLARLSVLEKEICTLSKTFSGIIIADIPAVSYDVAVSFFTKVEIETTFDSLTKELEIDLKQQHLYEANVDGNNLKELVKNTATEIKLIEHFNFIHQIQRLKNELADLNKWYAEYKKSDDTAMSSLCTTFILNASGTLDSLKLNKGAAPLHSMLAHIQEQLLEVQAVLEHQQNHTKPQILQDLSTAKLKFSTQIDLINAKINEFEMRITTVTGKDIKLLIDAMKAAIILRDQLQHAATIYFNDPTPDAFEQFKTNCHKHIEKAHEELDNHRGWSEFLTNLVLGIATLGVGLIVKGVINFFGGRSFWAGPETDSCKRLREIEDNLNSMMPVA